MLLASRRLGKKKNAMKKRHINKNTTTMSCNGVGALKCQCLCQLPKHAARLQSKITSTSDSASLKCNRLLFLLSMYLALGDIEGIFKQYLKHLSFSPLTPVPFKYTLKKLLVLSKISGAVIAFTFT